MSSACYYGVYVTDLVTLLVALTVYVTMRCAMTDASFTPGGEGSNPTWVQPRPWQEVERAARS